MTTWRRSEPFCIYVARRRAARRRMLADAYRRAKNRTSRTLARQWQFDPNQVMAATLMEAAAGDAEALAWLRVCAPDKEIITHEAAIQR